MSHPEFLTHLFSTHDFNRGISMHLLMRTVLTVFKLVLGYKTVKI